jgi:hypothetical protein
VRLLQLAMLDPNRQWQPTVFSKSSRCNGKSNYVVLDLMAVSAVCAVFIARDLLKAKTLQNLTKTGINKNLKK